MDETHVSVIASCPIGSDGVLPSARTRSGRWSMSAPSRSSSSNSPRWSRRFRPAQNQFNQAHKQYQSMTGNRGMQNLLSGVNRNYLRLGL